LIGAIDPMERLIEVVTKQGTKIKIEGPKLQPKKGNLM